MHSDGDTRGDVQRNKRKSDIVGNITIGMVYPQNIVFVFEFNFGAINGHHSLIKQLIFWCIAVAAILMISGFRTAFAEYLACKLSFRVRVGKS